MRFTKERLEEIAEDGFLKHGESKELARMALAGMEAEPGEYLCHVVDNGCGEFSDRMYFCLPVGTKLYTAPQPLTTSERAELENYRNAQQVVPGEQHSERFDWTYGDWAEHLGGRHQNNDPANYYEFGSFMAVAEMLRQFGNVQRKAGWNACRAAMLQGKAEQPQNSQQNIPENIPATQFKPVSDLYGLTSPTGGETSFTFDAVEARDFIDGGWTCQEYVELERYQAPMVNHPEDNLDMVDHSGDTNEKGNSLVIPEELLSAMEEVLRISDRDHDVWHRAKNAIKAFRER